VTVVEIEFYPSLPVLKTSVQGGRRGGDRRVMAVRLYGTCSGGFGRRLSPRAGSYI
jgi:hypothetical protein